MERFDWLMCATISALCMVLGGIVGFAIGQDLVELPSCPKVDCSNYLQDCTKCLSWCPKVGITKCDQIIKCDSTDLALKCIDLINDAETVKNAAGGKYGQ